MSVMECRFSMAALTDTRVRTSLRVTSARAASAAAQQQQQQAEEVAPPEFEIGTTAEIAKMLSHAFEGFTVPPPTVDLAVRPASATAVRLRLNIEPDVAAIMAKAQAIADKAVAEHAARTKDTEEPRERDFSREDAEKRARSRSRSREREREPEQTEMLPPRAFGAPGAPVVVEGTGGHEGRIIGRGGANIKDMQARYQVNIQIKRPEGVTEVTGVGAEACANEIRKIIEDAKALAGGGGAPTNAAPVTDPNAVTETIMCDGVEGRIIGKGGQNIRALMERTGASP